MKKFFIFSDVHSFYNELIIALHRAGFDKDNPDHIIVSLGDAFDRGPDPLKVVRFFNSLPSERKILIAGNHEDLLVEAINRHEFQRHDYSNGTAYTIAQFGWDDKANDWTFERAKKNNELYQYLSELVDYAETDDCIFTHGWIPYYENYEFNEKWRYGNWAQARWKNGMDAWAHGIRVPNKTIFCGHWNTSYGHANLHNVGSEWGTGNKHACFDPFIDEGIVALDGCVPRSHFVNIVVKEI